MKTIFSSIALLFTTAFFAQSITETRPVGDFTGIRASSVVKLEITQGEACAVIVEGQAKEVADLKTEVKDGVLSISGSNASDDEELKVKVTIKNLNMLDVSSALNTSSTNKIVTDSLHIIGSGVSSVKLDVQATSIKTSLSGASTVKISGTATHLTAGLSGASQLKAYDLITEHATLTTSGASSARVNATASLQAVTSGASEIHYQGNPAEKNINSSGASSVSMKDGSKIQRIPPAFTLVNMMCM